MGFKVFRDEDNSISGDYPLSYFVTIHGLSTHLHLYIVPLVQLKNICLSFGDQPLLDQINLTIQPNERIALVGRNGTGKSTLLKLLEQKLQPDEGEIIFQDGLIVEKLVQEIPSDVSGDVRSVIAQSSTQCGSILNRYYQLHADNSEPDDELQALLNENGAWEIDQKVQTLASKFDLNPKQSVSNLSGGLQRRVFLAQSLLNDPDLLLLDEPTNHLDIATIEWMERMLIGLRKTLLIVSHDRLFINHLSTRIIDLDRGKISSWPGNFNHYLLEKEKHLDIEQQQQNEFDKRLAKEEIWIRQGVQARRTRNEGRVRALKKMRSERTDRRGLPGSAGFKLNEDSQSGQIVVQTIDVNYRYRHDEPVINNFSTTVLRGDKIGIIGQNGCGKSTLIKLLTGELKPDSGSIRLGTQLNIAYLDQYRSDIREDYSLLDNIAQGASEVTINGKSRHVMSYIQDFLFSPRRAQVLASALSGGERNRLILARLFTQPFNLLILDEPTNDLDIDTLELLEQRLVEYQGTLLLVSHDRTFLNNIVTSTLVFDKNYHVNEYLGGYDDWLLAHQQTKQTHSRSIAKNPRPVTEAHKTRKMGFKEKRELEALPILIEELEMEIKTLQQKMSGSDFYKQEQKSITQANRELTSLQNKLKASYARWEMLESICQIKV